MPLIHLTTFIAAPRERVFDLSRSIDLHKTSMSKYGETPIGGTIAGLINLNEEVTWKAKHFFKERILKVKISEMKRPDIFIDEQVEGDFTRMKHEHYFKQAENGTIMIDQFYFEIAYGTFGKIFTGIYLERYLQKLLEQRNSTIKSVAEGSHWKHYLS
jgi:ligand-binding SRPBCC domain-containing protein